MSDNIIIAVMKAPTEEPKVGCGSLLTLAFVGMAVFGIGRCFGCEWAHSEAEKNIGKEISWGTKAELGAGKRYEFICPSDGTPGDVVGTEFYDAMNSSICTSAVHAGFIGLKNGGRVTIEVLEKKGEVLLGSQKNGIRSTDGQGTKGRKQTLSGKDAGEPDWTDKVFVVVSAAER